MIPKFRAWHKAERRMFKVFRLSWYHGIFLIGDKDSEEGRRFGSGEVELMQWTGLTDKHGKDIYEDDILMIEGATAKVVFWQRPPEFGLNFYHNEDEWCEDWNLSDDSNRMKIIGNIWETPELLQPTEEVS